MAAQSKFAAPRLGDMAIAKSLPTSYSLPKGLPEGSTVKLVSFDHGYYMVEWEGKRFQVFMACIHKSGDADLSLD